MQAASIFFLFISFLCLAVAVYSYTATTASPNTPLNVTVAGANQKIAVSYSGNNPGLTTLSYQITCTPTSGAAIIRTTTTTNYTVTGLTNGVQYSVSVIAINTSTNAQSQPSIIVTATPAPTAPETAPLNVQVVPNNASCVVSFTPIPSAQNGGATITSYVASAKIGNSSTTVTGTGTTSPITITGLTNDTLYAVTVIGINSIGNSPISSSVSVTPNFQRPSVPQNVSATVGIATGSGCISVTCDPPTSDGGSLILSYSVFTNILGDTSTIKQTTSTSRTILVTGLTNGVAYQIQMVATNSIGVSDKTAAISATPNATVTVPTAPTISSVLPGNNLVIISCTTPSSNGGSAITKYVATSTPGSFTGFSSDTNIVVTGLQNGTPYTFTIHATNSVGNSAESAPSQSVTPTSSSSGSVPGQPIMNTATAGNQHALVDFSAPSSTGGSNIVQYRVYASPNPASTTLNPQTTTNPGVYTFTGLTKNVSYSFTASAVNVEHGEGLKSSSSNSVTITGTPDAPPTPSATFGGKNNNDQLFATVSITPPSNTGGFPITSYVVTATSSDSTSVIKDNSSTTTVIVNGLEPGKTYSFTAAAINVNGSSVESSASIPLTMPTVPLTPTSVSAVYQAQGGQPAFLVNWTAPSSSGSGTITNYTITTTWVSGSGTVVPEPVTVASNVTSKVITGFDKTKTGTIYQFSVHATNIVGDGPESAFSNTVSLPTQPTAGPTNINVSYGTITIGSGTITLTWDPVSADGGSPITSYTVKRYSTSSGGTAISQSITAPTVQCTLSGLFPDTACYFTVTANNVIGESIDGTVSLSNLPDGAAKVGNRLCVTTYPDLMDPSSNAICTAPISPFNNFVGWVNAKYQLSHFEYVSANNPGVNGSLYMRLTTATLANPWNFICNDNAQATYTGSIYICNKPANTSIWATNYGATNSLFPVIIRFNSTAPNGYASSTLGYFSYNVEPNTTNGVWSLLFPRNSTVASGFSSPFVTYYPVVEPNHASKFP